MAKLNERTGRPATPQVTIYRIDRAQDSPSGWLGVGYHVHNYYERTGPYSLDAALEEARQLLVAAANAPGIRE